MIIRAKPAGQWHAGRILFALAARYDWRQNLLMTEFECEYGRADLVMISRSGYLTEFEIKISLSDWNADQMKRKFQMRRPRVSRFYYVIPETLEKKIPEWLPAGSGLLVVRSSITGHDHLHEIRPARRIRAEKVPEHWRQKIMRSCYYRFWGSEIRRLRRSFSIERQAA